VIVLDAYRNNPFRSSRDLTGGLAPMSNGAVGTLIAFATSDRKTASDNPTEANGLYTKQLIQALKTPGVDLRTVFQNAKVATYEASKSEQNPAIYDNMIGSYYLLGEAKPDAAPPKTDASVVAWNEIRDATDPAVFDRFALRYPTSALAASARFRAERLRRPEVALAAGGPHIVSTDATPAGETKTNPKEGRPYVYIPAGSFVMGCSPGERYCSADENPPHLVNLSKGFWMEQTTVTFGTWKKFRLAAAPPVFLPGTALDALGAPT
jgi:hypothetical protein